MNIPEPYKLYFSPMRQERYYGSLLSWNMDEGKRSFGNLVPQDIYAAGGAEKINSSVYQIVSGRKYAEPFAADGDFENVAGKGKLCRQAGLTGAEKKACKQNIKTQCGKKPRGFLGLKGARKRELQQKWEECARGMIVTPEQAAEDIAERIVPEGVESLGMGAKVMLGVGIAGTIILIGFAVASKMKKKSAAPKAAMTAPMAR